MLNKINVICNQEQLETQSVPLKALFHPYSSWKRAIAGRLCAETLNINLSEDQKSQRTTSCFTINKWFLFSRFSVHSCLMSDTYVWTWQVFRSFCSHVGWLSVILSDMFVTEWQVFRVFYSHVEYLCFDMTCCFSIGHFRVEMTGPFCSSVRSRLPWEDLL